MNSINQNIDISGIKNWFALAVPEPTEKNGHVQVGVHYEEACEMATELRDWPQVDALKAAADAYKRGKIQMPQDIDRVALLDSLCDQIVTAIGIGHMFGLDVGGALAEVNRSNWSKFVDGKPQFDANGKIMKPATYSPPQLVEFAGSAEV